MTEDNKSLEVSVADILESKGIKPEDKLVMTGYSSSKVSEEQVLTAIALIKVLTGVALVLTVLKLIKIFK